MNGFSSKEPVRLSESSLWRLLSEFYGQRGVNSWTQGTVPQRISTNGLIADVYAGIVAEFLRETSRDSDAPKPLVLELGAGNGLFAWLMYRRLRDHHALPERGGKLPPFDMLITDIERSTIDAWSRSPKLARLGEERDVHFGVFKVDGPIPCRTRSTAGASIDLDRPIVLIANYVLDSLPADLLHVRAGTLMEERVTLARPSNGPQGVSDLNDLTVASTSEAVDLPYSAVSGVDDVIRELLGSGEEGILPIPTGFLEFIEPLLNWKHPFLILAGDMAVTDPELLETMLVEHREYYAMTTNFYLVGRAIEAAGGTAIMPADGDRHFSVCALLGPSADLELRGTLAAARHSLSWFDPRDAHILDLGLEGTSDPLDYDMIMAWGSLMRWDAPVTAAILPHLMRLADAGEPLKGARLREGLLEGVRNNVPEVTDQVDLTTQVALFFLKAKLYEAVLDLVDEADPPSRDVHVWTHAYAVALARLQRTDEAEVVIQDIHDRAGSYWSSWPCSQGGSIVSSVLSELDDGPHLDHMILQLSISELMSDPDEPV